MDFSPISYENETDICPVCDGTLEVDVEAMQDYFGPLWYEFKRRQWIWFCESCGNAGTMKELKQVKAEYGEEGENDE